VLAHHQTQGRGRLGRTWFDRPGESLLFSVMLRYSGPVELAGFLGLVAGVAAARALQAHLDRGCKVNLKWPNDILLNGRKAGGVLAETVTRVAPWAVVVGVGLNMSTPLSELPQQIRLSATSVEAESDVRLAREVLLADILMEWERLFDELLEARTQNLREAWESVGPAKGTMMERTEGGPLIRGAYEGIGPRGELRLRDERGRVHEVFAGETA